MGQDMGEDLRGDLQFVQGEVRRRVAMRRVRRRRGDKDQSWESSVARGCMAWRRAVRLAMGSVGEGNLTTIRRGEIGAMTRMGSVAKSTDGIGGQIMG